MTKPVDTIKPDRAHDILQRDRAHPLDTIFRPKSIALIGATESPNTIGRTLAQHLLTGSFAGPVYPINPKRPTILGKKAYPSVAAVPEKPDLAVIVTPATAVPGLIGECIDVGIKSSPKPGAARCASSARTAWA